MTHGEFCMMVVNMAKRARYEFKDSMREHFDTKAVINTAHNIMKRNSIKHTEVDRRFVNG